MKKVIYLVMATLILGCDNKVHEPSAEYKEEMANWYQKRLAAITGEGGWGTLVGLQWLKEGENLAGSDSSGQIIFPPDAPAHLGTFYRQGDQIIFVSDKDIQITVEDTLVTEVSILPESNQEFRWKTFTWYIIVRGEKYGVRMKNSESETIKHFKGLTYFPLDPKWKLQARFEPHTPPKTMKVENILGMIDDYPNPGTLYFQVDGTEYSLEALDEGEDEYFIIFSDETSARETYGAGRYMYISKEPVDGFLTLDFNKAYNPPCAFTPYATCPLPPKENQLPFAITAGEKDYH